MNIILTREDLQKLLKGEVIKKGDNNIALSDIGYNIISQDLNEIYMEFIQNKKYLK
jgi:hypothetical protein